MPRYATLQALSKRVLSYPGTSARVLSLQRLGAFVLAFTLLSASLLLAAGTTAPSIVKATGMAQSTRQALHLQLDQVKKAHPELPASSWAKVEAQIEASSLEQDMATIWEQTYTESELKEIAKFLATPVGQKFFKTNPNLMPRLASVAALSGIKAFQVLQSLHPDKFPRSPEQEAQVKKLFETMKSGSQGGAR